MLRPGIEPWLTAWRGLPLPLRLQNRQLQELHRMRILRLDWRRSMSLARMSLVSSLYLIDIRSFVDYSQSIYTIYEHSFSNLYVYANKDFGEAGHQARRAIR